MIFMKNIEEFQKKYAEFLGLDYENVVWPLFAQECPKDGAISKSTTQEEISPEDYTPQTTETSFLENGEKTSKKSMYAFFVIIVLAAVGYAGYYLYSSNYFSSSLSSADNKAPQQAAVVTNNEPTITFEDDNQSDNTSYFNYYGSSIYADNKCIGTIGLKNIDQISRNAEMFISIGDSSFMGGIWN